nr:transmembrane protein 161A isoform X10 [Macaca fascicularis]
MGWWIGWLKPWQVTGERSEREKKNRLAVLGVQLVVTLLTATLMHRLAPHCSFARWLLCNGRIPGFEVHCLNLPAPYLSFPDCPSLLSVCSDTSTRPRRSFGLWRGSRGPEAGKSGLASMTQNLEPLLKKQDWDWVLPVAKLAIRVGLAVVGSVLGAFLTFPGLRLAQTHRDALTMSEDRPMLQFLLHTSFLSPLFILWLWTKPIARDFLHQPPFGERPFSLLSDSAFDSGRLWLLVVLCLLRLAVTRPHLQAYLCLAKARVEQLRREAGRIEAREIQRRVVRVYCYVTVVSLQYLTPLILTLNCTLLLKTLGGYSWGLGPAPLLSPNPSSASAASIGFGEDEVQQTAARIAGALGGLLTPLFLRGILAYLIWWTAACQLLCSLFGLYFHQHLAGS